MISTSRPTIVDFYVSRRIGFSELLPWEVVDSLIPKTLLEREAMRAHNGEDWVHPTVPGYERAEEDEVSQEIGV